MSRPGMALSAPGWPYCRRISREGTGEPVPIREPRSPWVAGVGTAVVASPKSAFISSRRTPLVSGYRKYTIRG